MYAAKIRISQRQLDCLEKQHPEVAGILCV
jgi:hypothetical protein